MKKIFRSALTALTAIALAVPAYAGVIESWAVLDSANIGTYADTQGSFIMFLTTDGPKAGERALKIESTLKPGGYCGIWHNLAGANLKEGAVKFMAKSTNPGQMQMAIKDKYNNQYTAFFNIPSKEWSEVIVNMSDFTLDGTYTPPDAIKGKPMDVTEVKGMNFGPKMEGDATIILGPVSTSKPGKSAPAPAAKPAAAKKAAPKPAAAKKAAPKPAAKAVEKAAAPSAVAQAAPAAKPAAEGKVGGTAEGWTTVDSSNTGTYADSNGSKISFSVVEGPKAGEKALKIEGEMAAGGYMGIWHNIAADLSKAGALRIPVKSSVAQDVQIAIKDKYNVQYVTKFPATTAWSDAIIPVGSFAKDPYYTPPDAIPGNPMDLSETKGINFAPQNPGASVLTIGPVVWIEGKVDAPAAAAAAPAVKATGAKVIMQDFSKTESGICGTYADTNGSSIAYEYKDAKKKDNAADKMLSIKYKLVGGGWCGIWYRAGDGWDGVDCSNAAGIELTVYTPKSMVIQIALKDKTNNQYIGDAPATKGGSWEKVVIPMTAFTKDPYYTPPEAIKGAPADFSQVKTFNIVPKTEGEATFAIDTITVLK